ncbi:MAG TPA: hypothetical protein VIH31_01160 [Candidatus Paceibacterota bacterium]
MKTNQLFLLGEGYLRVKKYDDALEVFLKIKKLFRTIKSVLHAKIITKDVIRLQRNLVACGTMLLKDRDSLSEAISAFKAAEGKLPRELFINRGNKYLREKDFTEALECFKTVKAKDKLVVCGKLLIKYNWDLKYIIEAFTAAGTTPPKEILIPRSEKLLKDGAFDEAMKGFLLAKVNPPKESLIAYAERSLEHEYFDEAMLAYKMAKAIPSEEKLIVCANSALKRDVFYTVEKVLRIIKSKEVITSFGDRYHRIDRNEYAFKAYALAKDKDKLVKLAESCLARGGQFKLAIQCYKEAGLEVPRERMIRKGKQLIENCPEDALEYFSFVKDKKGIIACGDSFLNDEEPGKAAKAYALAESLN